MSLTSEEVASMRSTLDASLPDTCTIKRLTPSSDGQGGTTLTPTDLATNVKCRVSPATGIGIREQQIAGQVQAPVNFVVSLPANQDILPKDRIVIGTRTLEAQSVLRRESWELCRRVLCAELQ